MQEVEVKARVRDRAALEQALLHRGLVIAKKVSQDDRIYLPNACTVTEVYEDAHKDWAAYVLKRIPVIRVRREECDGARRALLTLKFPMVNELDCEEHETEVSDPDAMDAILLASGFYSVPQVWVTKRREKGNLGAYEICLDDVDGLGSFIEVEKMTDGTVASEVVQEELFQFLESVGVKREDRVESGYDTLAYERSITH